MILKRNILLILFFILLFATPCSADFAFEGIPLEVVAQGTIQGEVVQLSLIHISEPTRPY